jgi:hypothetical protein
MVPGLVIASRVPEGIRGVCRTISGTRRVFERRPRFRLQERLPPRDLPGELWLHVIAISPLCELPYVIVKA